MKLYRFSPIESRNKLLEAIKYVHLRCSELCKKNFGRILPVAGNVGIFSHSEDEYSFLTALRQELTVESDNWNKKYYRLYEPVIIPAQGDLPGATYTYLYVRHPDQHTEVGDADFVLGEKEYDNLKRELSAGTKIEGIEILDRSDLDLLKLSGAGFDVLAFIGTKSIDENVNKRVD